MLDCCGDCIILTDSLPNGTDGTPYSQVITADVPSTFAVIDGALPDGLTLDPDGTISGTPNLANPYTFTVQATPDSGGEPCTRELSITILPNEPPGFEPPRIEDLVFWVDRDSLSALSDNDPVEMWNDDGQRGNHFEPPDISNAPTWDAGENGVRFNGVDQRLLCANQGTTETVYTMFAAFKFDAATGTQGVCRIGDLTGGYGFYKDTGNRSVIHRAVTGCADGACTTDTEVWSAVRTEGPNLLRFFVNGVSTAISNDTSNVNTPDGGAMHIGIFATAAALFMAGVIFELAIYEVALDDTDRETWENYLIAKHV